MGRRRMTEREYPYRYTPDMFDYPMSYSYYRGLCQEHGWADPGPDRPIEGEEEIKLVFRPRPIDDEVDQLKAGFIHLQKKHAEMMLAIDKLTKRINPNDVPF